MQYNQLLHLWQFVTAQPASFSPFRSHLVPLLVKSLIRTQQGNAPAENRKMSLTVANMLVTWEENARADHARQQQQQHQFGDEQQASGAFMWPSHLEHVANFAIQAACFAGENEMVAAATAVASLQQQPQQQQQQLAASQTGLSVEGCMALVRRMFQCAWWPVNSFQLGRLNEQLEKCPAEPLPNDKAIGRILVALRILSLSVTQFPVRFFLLVFI
jgi:hypothetical protein